MAHASTLTSEMHGGGLGITVRQSVQHIKYAKPWQQALFTDGMLLAGVALLALGVLVGLVPAVLGVLFVRPSVRSVRASLAQADKSPSK